MQWHWEWPICMDSIKNGHFAKAFKNLGLYETGQEVPVKSIPQRIAFISEISRFFPFKFAGVYRVYGVLSDV